MSTFVGFVLLDEVRFDAENMLKTSKRIGIQIMTLQNYMMKMMIFQQYT